MRLPCFFVLGLVALPSFALEYPDPPDAAAKALVAQYKQDKTLLDSPDLLSVPNPAPAWPCPIPEVELYKIFGLHEAHPDLKAEFAKMQRKHLRQAGISGDMLGNTTFSNIQIIPLKAQCVNGKLDGELEALLSYDRRMEQGGSITSGEKTIRYTSITNMSVLSRNRYVMQAGVQTPQVRTISQMSTKVEQRYDDPAMNETTRKQNQSLGLDKPTTVRSITYTSKEGIIASFSEMDEKKVSAGLFSPKVETVSSLSTMFMFPVDERRKRNETYKNKQLLATSWMKDNKQHGESILYMENYVKKFNLRLDQQPNMENAREVTIDGVDLIEKRTCYREGVLIKTATCSNE